MKVNKESPLRTAVCVTDDYALSIFEYRIDHYFVLITYFASVISEKIPSKTVFSTSTSD